MTCYTSVSTIPISRLLVSLTLGFTSYIKRNVSCEQAGQVVRASGKVRDFVTDCNDNYQCLAYQLSHWCNHLLKFFSKSTGSREKYDKCCWIHKHDCYRCSYMNRLCLNNEHVCQGEGLLGLYSKTCVRPRCRRLHGHLHTVG